MWPAAVAYDSATKEPGPVKFNELGDMGPIERFGLETTVHDFLASRPAMVLSLIALDQPGWGMQRLDLLRWLRRDRGFSAAWVAYDSLGRVGNYTIWARRGTASDISKLFRVAPPQDASLARGVRANSTSLAAAVVFLAVFFVIYRQQRAPTG
jgi:hypothetical protein